MKNKLLLPLLLPLFPCVSYGALNFGTRANAPAGSTTWQDSNIEGFGPESGASGVTNTTGGGNVIHTIGGTNLAGGANTFNGDTECYFLDADTNSFTIDIDYLGWTIDNSGGWYDFDGTNAGGGGQLSFSGMLLDNVAGFGTEWGYTVTIEGYDAGGGSMDHDINPIVGNPGNINVIESNTNSNPNTNTSTNNDWDFTNSGSSISYTTVQGLGGDGVTTNSSGNLVPPAAIWRAQTGGAWGSPGGIPNSVPGPSSPNNNYVQSSGAQLTFTFVDFDPGNGIESFEAGQKFRISSDGGLFRAEIVPEPSRALLLGVFTSAFLVRRRRR